MKLCQFILIWNFTKLYINVWNILWKLHEILQNFIWTYEIVSKLQIFLKMENFMESEKKFKILQNCIWTYEIVCKLKNSWKLKILWQLYEILQNCIWTYEIFFKLKILRNCSIYINLKFYKNVYKCMKHFMKIVRNFTKFYMNIWKCMKNANFFEYWKFYEIWKSEIEKKILITTCMNFFQTLHIYIILQLNKNVYKCMKRFTKIVRNFTKSYMNV